MPVHEAGEQTPGLWGHRVLTPYSESAPANLTLTAPPVGTIAPAIPEETEAQGRLDNPMRKQQRSVSSRSPQNVASYSFNMHATQPRVTSDSTLLPLSPESWGDGCVPPFLGFGLQIREVG